MGRTDLLGTEVVERGEEDGEGGVDADDPGEGEEVVKDGEEHWQTDDHLKGAFHGSEEGAALASTSPLFDAYHAQEAGPAGRLLAYGDAPVIEGLVEKEDDGDEAQTRLDAVQPERPLPFLRGDDESGEEGSEVRG